MLREKLTEQVSEHDTIDFLKKINDELRAELEALQGWLSINEKNFQEKQGVFDKLAIDLKYQIEQLVDKDREIFTLKENLIAKDIQISQ